MLRKYLKLKLTQPTSKNPQKLCPADIIREANAHTNLIMTQMATTTCMSVATVFHKANLTTILSLFAGKLKNQQKTIRALQKCSAKIRRFLF